MIQNKYFMDTRTGELVTSFSLTDIKYMREADPQTCPKCNKLYAKGYHALSRRDNTTAICGKCGTLEALEDYKESLSN